MSWKMTQLKKIKYAILFILGIVLTTNVFAGDPPPVGGDPTSPIGGGTPIGGSAPIGQGYLISILIVFIYLIYKYYFIYVKSIDNN